MNAEVPIIPALAGPIKWTRSRLLTDQTRMAIDGYLRLNRAQAGPVFIRRSKRWARFTTRQYARLVQQWVASIGLDPAKFDTHSLRRTKAVLIYRRTGTSGPFSFCSDIRRSRARFATSGLRSMTRSISEALTRTPMSGRSRRCFARRRSRRDRGPLLYETV